ncbi:flavin reductase family protein [Acidobacteriota bacterium]
MKKSIGAKTLIFPTPVLLVATYDADERPNALTIAWGGVCCSQPPCVTVSLRKNRYSFNSLVKRKAFTVNILSQDHAAEMDYFGMASGRREDKFAKTGFTAVKSDLVDAPYIAESPLVLECVLRHTHEIGVHIQFIGEVLDAKADESVLDEKGIPDIGKVRPMMYAPEGGQYHGVGPLLGKAYSMGVKYKK